MKQYRILLLTAIVSMLLLAAIPVAAFPAASYSLVKHTIDSSGHMRSGQGRFQLSGTMGQADSSTMQQNGRFALVGGYWGANEQSGPTPTPTPNGPDTSKKKVFLPLIHE